MLFFKYSYMYISNDYVHYAIKLAPLLVIFKDCVFNDFQIRYLSSYILFYTPVLITSKISNYYKSILLINK